jgi:hypothetical protein
MKDAKFNCKKEEVPAIAGFVNESLIHDLIQFREYSPEFNDEFVAQFNTKRNYCLELESSDITTKRLKAITTQLVKKEKGLRPLLNKLEGYLNLAGSALDIPAESFGIKAVRDAINKSNDEGVIASMQTVLKNIKRNNTVLLAKGLKQELTDSLSATVTEIDLLNIEQNKLTNERNNATASNIKDYNELWDMLSTVCATARSLYRGVDELKLKEYTVTELLKRVNAEGPNSKGDSEAAAK